MDDTHKDTVSRSARLVTGSIAGHLVKQASPLALGVFALMSVGLIDAYFIGRLGADELAAVSFIFPVTTALSSLGVGVMAGISSVVARALGAGDDKRAHGLAVLGILLAAGLGVLVAGLLYALRLPLFRLMQADDALLPLIDSYMQPYAPGFVLLVAMMGVNGVLRAQGAANRSSVLLISFAVVNWILDPLLINGIGDWPGLGVAGAAWATIGGWLAGAVLGFVLLAGTDLPFVPAKLRHADLRAGAAALARIGGPAAFSNSVNPVGLSVLTALLAGSGQAAVAGYGAGGRLQSFAVVPLLALSGAIGAIIGQNWGAEEYGRARKALIYSCGFALAYGTGVAALLVLLRESLAGLFTQDPQVLREMSDYLLIAAWGYGGYGVLIVANGALNAVDRAGTALLQSLARVALVMIPVSWLLGGLWQERAVYVAELAANLIGGAIAAISLYWIFWRTGAPAGDQPSLR
jgi:putative MATE family efflux protein